jgi:tetratricopeptide (TPR) repeat protein
LGNEPQAALDAFDAMTKAGFVLNPDAVPALIDGFVEGLPGDTGDSLRVSLLLKMLAVFRQEQNRQAMDQVYRLIIETQERLGDERKLVQFLKNYLEIKKVMGEIPGQLELIDQIGNRLFKLGDVAEAREYYELGLKIRADQQQADLTRTTAKPGTTPQTA